MNVHENIIQLRVPIPFPLRDVNMYALVGRDGWTLIDTAIGTPDTRAAFEAARQEAGLDLGSLQSIVLTHNHPDHVGLSGELHERSGAQVFMHPLDEAQLQRTWSQDPSHFFERSQRFFQQHGFTRPPSWLAQVQPDALRSIIRVPPHDAFTFIEDGQSIDLQGERYSVIWTPGHADGQICLFRARDGVFFSADHVLPRITPNIGLYSHQARENPLGDYLSALAKVSSLPARVVLPGHGDAFAHLSERITEIVAHHEQRLQHLLTLLVDGPQHAFQLTQRLFGARLHNDDARQMALAEVLAHLDYLRYKGIVTLQQDETDIILYTIAKKPGIAI